MKFIKYVGDGDSAVGKEILSIPEVSKEECQRNFLKTFRIKLVDVFHSSEVKTVKITTYLKLS